MQQKNLFTPQSIDLVTVKQYNHLFTPVISWTPHVVKFKKKKKKNHARDKESTKSRVKCSLDKKVFFLQRGWMKQMISQHFFSCVALFSKTLMTPEIRKECFYIMVNYFIATFYSFFFYFELKHIKPISVNQSSKSVSISRLWVPTTSLRNLKVKYTVFSFIQYEKGS